MSARSGPMGAGDSASGTGGVSTWLPLKWLIRANSEPGASTSSPLTQAASPPPASGQISPNWRASAWMAEGSAPATAVMRPSSASSPMAVKLMMSSLSTTSMAASRPKAMGRSKWLPSLARSAGARLTVMRLGGSARPSALSAPRTRSRDSATALSGSPTTEKAGRPALICTCTSTSMTSMPRNATVLMRATIRFRPECLCFVLLYLNRYPRKSRAASCSSCLRLRHGKFTAEIVLVCADAAPWRYARPRRALKKPSPGCRARRG